MADEPTPTNAREWDELARKTEEQNGPPDNYFKKWLDKKEVEVLLEQEGYDMDDGNGEFWFKEVIDDEDEDKGEEDEGKEDEEDDNDEGEIIMNDDEKMSIQERAARTSTRLGAVPGSILADHEDYPSDAEDESDYKDDGEEDLDGIEELFGDDAEMMDVDS